jgi:hypothetical protein
MIPVAVAGGVTLSCPSDGGYSFYNSPYPAHRLMAGIDIYPDPSGDAPSPVDGEVLQIRSVKAPQGHGFDAPEHDTVAIIGVKSVPGRVVKILHVDVEAKVGENVRVGQPLGPMIRSGYFGYQTPLHAHIEVRPEDDPIRVRGGYTMNSLLDLDHLEITDELTGTVTAARKGYAQLAMHQSNPWVVAEVDGKPAIIDGGIPLYGWFGLHLKKSTKGAQVSLLRKHIGKVTGIMPRTCVAECQKFTAMLGETPVDLFFVFHASGKTMTIATSKRHGELDVSEGADVSITIS